MVNRRARPAVAIALIGLVLVALAGSRSGPAARADGSGQAARWVAESDPQPPLLPNPPIDIRGGDKRCAINADLIVLVDSSNSISDADWQSQLRIVQQLAERFVPLGGVRLAVIPYGASGATRVEIPLTPGQGDNLAVISSRLFDLQFNQAKGATNLDEALTAAEGELARDGRYPEAYPVALIFGDFYYTAGEDPSTAAARLRARFGLSLFGLMVGSEVNQPLADVITGPPPGTPEAAAYYYRAENWSAALAGEMTGLFSFLCPAPAEHGLLVSPPAGRALTAGPVVFEWTRPVTTICVQDYTLEVFAYPDAPPRRVFGPASTAGTSLIWDSPPAGDQGYVVRLSTRFCNGIKQPFEWYIYTCRVCPPAAPSVTPPAATATPSPPPTTGAPTTQELPRARCSERSESGGAGVTTRVYDMAATSGAFAFEYNTYTIPDRIDIFYQGAVIFSTGGFVGEEKTVMVSFSGSSAEITVVVTGNTNSGTRWDYTVNCPGGAPPTGAGTPSATPNATVVTIQVRVDRGSGQIYRVGEPITICVLVNQTTRVRITDTLANGTAQMLWDGIAQGGRETCLPPGTVTLPTGTEVVSGEALNSQGVVVARHQTSFIVAGMATATHTATSTHTPTQSNVVQVRIVVRHKTSGQPCNFTIAISRGGQTVTSGSGQGGQFVAQLPAATGYSATVQYNCTQPSASGSGTVSFDATSNGTLTIDVQ